MTTQGTPHGIVGGLVQGVVDGLKGVGATVARALDKPPEALAGPQGIHHIPHRLLNGTADSVRTYVEGVKSALDQPVEQFGVPPDLAGGGHGLEMPKLPKLGKSK